MDKKSKQTKWLSDEEKRTRGIEMIEQWKKEMDDLELCNSKYGKSEEQENKKNNSWESLPDTLTALHISEYLHISRRRVYELFQLREDEGGIPNFEIGASKRVDKRDFQKWIFKKKSNK